MFKPVYTELSRSGAQTALYTSRLVPRPQSALEQKAGGQAKLYDEVLSDDQCFSALKQRVGALTSAETIVEDASDKADDKAAAESIRQMLKGLAWDAITDKMLMAIWYGHAVGECIYQPRDGLVWLADIKVRPRERFRYTRDFNRATGEGLIEITPAAPQGVERDPAKYWTTEFGSRDSENPYGIGLAHLCYWPTFFKKSDIRFWLTYLERFGQPTSMAKVPESWIKDAAKRGEVLDMLDAIQTDSGIVVPEGVHVELLEAARSGTADYAGLKKAMDEAIAKIVLGQTLTLENTGGQHKADNQKAVRDEVVKADADLICGSFNTQVVKWLTAWNFPKATPPRVWRMTEPPADLDNQAERDTKISKMGFRPTPEYIKSTYGEGWVQAQQNAPQAQQPAPSAGPAATVSSAEFAEAAALLAAKTRQRADQAGIAGAADQAATRYEELIGERVSGMMDFLDGTEDLAAFRRHLKVLMGEEPPKSLRDKLARSGFAARMAGLFKGQNV